MNRRDLLKKLTVSSVSFAIAHQAKSQLQIEVSGVGFNRYPIYVSQFTNQEILPVDLNKIIKNDLQISGEFDNLSFSVVPQNHLNINSTISVQDWNSKGVDYLVFGEITQNSPNSYTVKFLLYDCINNRSLNGKAFNTDKKNLRLTAHKISNYIYETITGYRGIFDTKIAYVTKNSNKNTLWIADYDAFNEKPALSSSLPIISPAWSPDGEKLAYVSYEQRKPIIYVQNVRTGQRKVVANFKGSNSAPTWCNNVDLIVTLTIDGNSQLYKINTNTNKIQRLSKNNSIDTEPVVSPDGQLVYFVSDRSGSPQIYQMNINGSNIKRLSFSSNYNVSPNVSPNGKYLTYLAKRNGKHVIMLHDLTKNNDIVIYNSGQSESPSFAPNSKLILFTNSGKLLAVSLDGRTVTNLSVSNTYHLPKWGPYTTN